MQDLAGKIALVTGASRGIGRAVALALAAAGVDLVVNWRSAESPGELLIRDIEAMGRRVVGVRADVSEAGAVGRLIAEAERLGPVGILVNNAGIARPLPPERLSEQDWDEVLAVNLKSAFLVTQAVLPGMRRAGWGRILMLSSIAAQLGGVIGPPYAASKAGLIGLAHSYAALLAREGITVNAIAPALVETDMVRGLGADSAKIPVGRFGTVEEVADLAMAVLRNGYVTGQTISINGGSYMT